MDTTPSPAHAQPSNRLARAVLFLVDAPIFILVLFVGVLGFIGSFDGVNKAMAPYFGDLSWIVPAGIDASILAFSAADLRLILRGIAVGGMRYVVWGLSAATVYLNTQTAHDVPGRIAHAMMPILWIIAVEFGRAATAKHYRLSHDTQMEPIPWDMWLNFLPTLRMWFRRRVNRIKTLDELVGREQARLLAVMRLRQQARADGMWFWRWRWRKVATADELWAIRTYQLDHTGAMKRTAAAVSKNVLGADLVAPSGLAPTPAQPTVNGAAHTPASAPTPTAPTPKPAPARTPPRPVNPGVNGSVNGVNGHAHARTAPVNGSVKPAAVIPAGRPENVSETTWANLWGNPEACTAWDAYVSHREETGEMPRTGDLRERAQITRDRTTVSKWMPMFHARWDAEHAVNTHTREGVNGDARTPVNETPAGVPEREQLPAPEDVPDTVPDTVAALADGVNDPGPGVNGDRPLVETGA